MAILWLRRSPRVIEDIKWLFWMRFMLLPLEREAFISHYLWKDCKILRAISQDRLVCNNLAAGKVAHFLLLRQGPERNCQDVNAQFLKTLD